MSEPNSEGDLPSSQQQQDVQQASGPTTIVLSRAVTSQAPIQLETVAAPEQPVAPARPRTPAPERTDGELLAVEDVSYTGELLRRTREARGLTVEQICERTRITRQHVENLEADQYGRLPPPVYLRGMLMALAKELRLDGQKVARSYMEAVAAASDGPAR